MADGVRALRNEGADISRRCNEAQTVLNVALVLAELIGKFSNAVPELGGHARKDCRLVERGEVLALKVLNHRNLDRLLIAHLFNDRGDHRERKRGDGTPASLAGNDLIACAETGSGKTCAFVVPMLQRILSTTATTKSRVLVLAPTRELAVQIEDEIHGLAYHTTATSTAVMAVRKWRPTRRMAPSSTTVVATMRM